MDTIKQTITDIGRRLKGLRESLDIPVEELAQLCEISPSHYLKMEQGKVDPSVYRLAKIAKKYEIDLNVLLFGEEPKMNAYFLTRQDQGLCVESNVDYKYHSLTAGFQDRVMDAFLVEVEPRSKEHKFTPNKHNGQEFIYVLEGELEITIDRSTLVLHSGDSIYFQGSVLHSMFALGGKKVKFLCVLV